MMSTPQKTVLEWRDGEVLADNGFMRRRWKLVDGLPVPLSLVACGQEWLEPDGQPGLVPPGGAPRLPVTVAWSSETGPGDPVEAPSHRGALCVTGSDGRGYRWHIQVFEGLPSITCRVEAVGGMQAGEGSAPLSEPAMADATGIETHAASHAETAPDVDLMERLPLAVRHTEFTVADLHDRTDTRDNLASERLWRLGPMDTVRATTCLAAIEAPLAGAGLALLKHAPLPEVRPVKDPVDVIARDGLVRLFGHGAGEEGQGYAWSVVAWYGGRWERTAALHRLQKCFRPYQAGRDGLFLSNTWGDRNRDARINEEFALSEIAAGARLGVDVTQVDDGWQKGVSANSAQAKSRNGVWNAFWAADSEFWTPDSRRFPRGLEPVAEAARANGMALGLWFAPDSSNDFCNWEKDAEVVLGFYRRHGIRFFKVDGVKIGSRRSELNLQRFFARVREESGGAVTIDLDVTAESRPGHFGAMQAGPIFLENRYTDWASWWPHASLRNLWELSWFVPPQRLRMEFLNPERNQEKYAGSPLAPAGYPSDYPFATTLVANPLAWFEVTGFPATRATPVADLAQIWRKHRDELHEGTTLPIGERPSGAAWTGFCSRGPAAAHVLIFRELSREAGRDLALPLPSGPWRVERVAGSGEAVWRGDRLHAAIPEPLHWLWVRLTPEP